LSSVVQNLPEGTAEIIIIELKNKIITTRLILSLVNKKLIIFKQINYEKMDSEVLTKSKNKKTFTIEPILEIKMLQNI